MHTWEWLERHNEIETVEGIADIYEKNIPHDIFYYIKDSVTNILHHHRMYAKWNNPNYKTLALTYNSEIPWHMESQYSERIPLGKNGRDDSHSYVTPIEYSEFLYRICNYTPVRAKISKRHLVGDKTEWHYDESIDECIKVIIPIETNDSLMFQLGNQRPIHLDEEKAYFFDASNHHRFVNTKIDSPVTHVVFGISTKYLYDYSIEKWFVNPDSSGGIDYLIDNCLRF